MVVVLAVISVVLLFCTRKPRRSPPAARARFFAWSALLWTNVLLLGMGSLSMWHSTSQATAVCAGSCSHSTLIFPVSIAVLLAIAVAVQILMTLVEGGRLSIARFTTFTLGVWTSTVVLELGVLQFWTTDATTDVACEIQASGSDTWTMCLSFSKLDRDAFIFVALVAFFVQAIAVATRLASSRLRQRAVEEAVTPCSVSNGRNDPVGR
jgi:hypothetical protein